MADVFLSYSRVDTDKAMIIKDALEALGLEVFFDVEGLDSGDVFPDVLDREVKAAGAVLSVWSSASINRPWVKKECGIAMERGVLVPVQIEPISLMDKPAAFADVQYTDLEQFAGEADHLGWERTVRALARKLGRPDLVKVRKKQVADKERAEKLAAQVERLKKSGGGYRFKLWHGIAGLAALALAVGGAVWTATSMQAAAFDRQLDDIFASNALEQFDEKAPDARKELAKILEKVSPDALERKAETDGRAALLLGWVYDFGEGDIAQNSGRAVQLYRKSCDLGIPRGCRNLANQYSSGEGASQDYAEAVRLYRQACEGGDMAAAPVLGSCMTTAGVPLRITRKRCGFTGRPVRAGICAAAAISGSCIDEAGALIRMTAKRCGFTGRPVRAGQSRAHVMGGCANLGFMYANGAGVEQDDVEAVRLYRQACEGGDMLGCSNLGVMYERGTGVDQDYAQAVRLYRQACEGGVMRGCAYLGVMYAEGRGVERDDAEAVRLYRQACEGGEMTGCGNLGIQYEYGRGVDQDIDEAQRLYKKACDGGQELACEWVE